MQFSEYLVAILDLCKLGGVARVGKLDTLHFLITWTPRNTNLQKNQFWQTLPTGAHFLTIRTYTISLQCYEIRDNELKYHIVSQIAPWLRQMSQGHEP